MTTTCIVYGIGVDKLNQLDHELLQLPTQVSQVVAQGLFWVVKVAIINAYIIYKGLALRKRRSLSEPSCRPMINRVTI